MNLFKQRLEVLRENPKRWLVTGVSGFIGSNILEVLLNCNQTVVGLDNFATGHKHNLSQVKAEVTSEKWRAFEFIEGDITSFNDCRLACEDIDYVLHQAALGSVPRSIKDPIATNQTNITGFVNLITAAKEEGVSSFTYAASSSTYGDHQSLPKVEDVIGEPLSPYAVTKYVNELYANVFSRVYGFHSLGLRYFNVFGKRQDPNGAYAAVIPKWIGAMISGNEVVINGDGETSRDFCFIDNVVQANILAATKENLVKSDVFNVALGDRTTLNNLFFELQTALAINGKDYKFDPVYKDFRQGDVRHSQADISKAMSVLGYSPEVKVSQGILLAMPWYVKNLRLETVA